MTHVAGFWDSVYSSGSYSREINGPVVEAAAAFFGNLEGKSILEIGCGPGATSLCFASRGADVTGIDISSRAIEEMNEFCRNNGLSNVRGICADVMRLGDLPPVDFVFGAMILHHLEPFDSFVCGLQRVLKPGGRAFFYENNAASRTLIWFRRNIVGQLWVPKYGDPDEFPLTPQEVDRLKTSFDVEIQYPEMLFFALFSVYILRGRFYRWFASIDRFLYRKKWFLKYSYRQFVLVRAKP